MAKTKKSVNKSKNISLLGNKRKRSESDIIEIEEILETKTSKKNTKNKETIKSTKNLMNKKNYSKNRIKNKNKTKKKSYSSKQKNLSRKGAKTINSVNVSSNEVIELDEESKNVKNNISKNKTKKSNEKNIKNFDFENKMLNDVFNKSLIELKGKLMDQLFTEIDLSITQKKNFIPKTFLEKMHEIQKKGGNLGKCVYCKRNDRVSYCCEKCHKFMHPECFMAYHKNNVYCKEK